MSETPVHYDVDRFLADARANCMVSEAAALALASSDHDRAYIRAQSVFSLKAFELTAALLTELNNGGDETILLRALGHVMGNFDAGVTSGASVEAIHAYLEQCEKTFAHALSGRDDPDYTADAGIMAPHMPGSRA